MRDIAEQSGLSEATIDRVLHGRPGASARAVRAVEQAVLDLDRQQTQLRLAARTLLLDVVVQAPSRFSSAVRSALEDELPALRPAAVRARFHLRENADVDAAVEVLDGLGRRGRVCHGVVLKAPDDPAVASAVARLAARGIPVVTLVTDVRDSARVAYVGLDNAAAGATAAYLVSQVLGDRPGDVLLTPEPVVLLRRARAGRRLHGRPLSPRPRPARPHDHRQRRARRHDGRPRRRPAPVAAGRARGLLGRRRQPRHRRWPSPRPAVTPVVFIAHDLDEDNLDLLRSGVLTAVLHHDLHADMRAGVRQVMRAHRLVPGAPTSVAANVEVVTAYNIPPRIHAH